MNNNWLYYNINNIVCPCLVYALLHIKPTDNNYIWIYYETIDLFLLTHVNYHFKACVRERGGNLGVCCEPPKPARQLLPRKTQTITWKKKSLFKWQLCRQVQQQSPVAVNVNGIPSPEPGSAVVTQEMGPQVSFCQCIIREGQVLGIPKLVRIIEMGPIF